VVEAPRVDVPRPAAVVPKVEVAAGAAAAVLVIAACGAVVVAADAGLSGTLNKVLKGALEEAVGAPDEMGVWELDVPAVVVVRPKTFAIGLADEVVVGWLNRLLKVGALVDGGCDDVPPKSGFDFSAVDVVACVVDGVAEGNWNGLDVSEAADNAGGWKKRDGVGAEVEGADDDGVLDVFWPSPLNNGFWGWLKGVVDDGAFEEFCPRPPNNGCWACALVVPAGVVVWDASAGWFQENEGFGCFVLIPPKRLPPAAGGWAGPEASDDPDCWKELVVEFSLFPNRLFPPVLPPNRLVGGGPAGVVDGLVKEIPDGPGVVAAPAAAEVVVPPVKAPAKAPFISPGPDREPPSKGNFGGVCAPPRPPKDGMVDPLPKPPKAAAGLFSAVGPFDVLFSPALDAPRPEKPQPAPVDLSASPLPKRLLPVDWPVPFAPNRLLPGSFELPKRPDDDDDELEGVAPKVSLAGSLDMMAIAASKSC
jgi:hypothetical protein